MIECLQISYPLNLKGLEHLDEGKRREWKQKYDSDVYDHPLDVLYDMTTYSIELNKTKTLSEHVSESRLTKIRQLFVPEGKDRGNDLQAFIESWNIRCCFTYRDCPLNIQGRCRCPMYRMRDLVRED